MKKPKILVLLSGGLDSTTALALAVNLYGSQRVIALNAYYGQKHDKEIQCARRIANYYRVEYHEMDLSTIYQYSDCSLLAHSDKKIIHKSYEDQIKENGLGAVETYVPFRNGLLLSVAVSYAMSKGVREIWFGAHKDDGAGRAYPDCTPEFVDCMNKAIYYGTDRRMVIYAPFLYNNKAEIVKEGLRLDVPYGLTWSCYEGKEKPCGKCGTCIDRIKAFEENNTIDPLEYWRENE